MSGGAAALLLFVGVSVGAAVMIWRTSRPAPVAFAGTTGTRAAAQSLAPGPVVVPEAPPVGPGAGPDAPGGIPPDGPGLPVAPDAPPMGRGPAPNAVAPPVLRAAPDVLQPDEAATAVVRFPLASLVFDKNMQSVLVLNGNGPAGPGGFAPPGLFPPPGGVGPPGAGGMANPINPLGPRGGLDRLRTGKRGVVRGNSPAADRLDGDLNTEWAALDANTDLTGRTLAVQAYPVRGVEIAASFPYKKEVEEFQNRLGLRSTEDVFAEQAGVMKDGLPLMAFRFLGVVVRRRELDAAGRPVGVGWKTLDVDGDYTALLTLAGRQTQPDAPELAAVAFPGLAMNKLPTLDQAPRPAPVTTIPTSKRV